MIKQIVFALLSFSLCAVSARAANVATDQASNAPYADGWQTGDNGGTGFDPWFLITTNANSATGGFFIGDSASNGGSGNIGAIAWGLYANSGDGALATRVFTIGGSNNATALAPGQTFSVSMDNGNVDTNSTVGFNLLNSSGADRFTFQFVGGGANYVYNLGDGVPVDTGVPFTRDGLQVSLTVGASNAFTLKIIVDGVTTTLSGTLNGSDIDRAQLFNSNAGGGSASDLFFNNMAIQTTTPTVTGAVSRKTHGSNVFDVPLPLVGMPGIEPRLGGATNDYTMVVTFSGSVSVSGSPQAQVIAGTGTIGSGGVSNSGAVTVSGNEVTIPLTNVTSQQTIQVRLNGVNGAGSVTIPMSVLVGDASGDGQVNSGDTTITRGRSGQSATAATFRSDVNADGDINAADVSVTRSRSGNFIP